MARTELIPHSKDELLTGAAKRLTPPAISRNMVHVIPTTEGPLAVRGLSRTQSSEIVSPGLGSVNGGDAQNTLLKQGHFNTNVPIHPGMTEKQKAEHDPTIGSKVLAEGKLASGDNRHPVEE
jgi:hypothetical protein